MKAITNHHWRDIEYLEIDGESKPCFHFYGEIYDLDDFMRHEEDGKFYGLYSDSAFSGIRIDLSDDGDKVKVTRLLA